MDAIRDIEAKFKAQGMKVTPQRIAVYQAMTVLGHACTDDVVAEVHRHTPSISVATIYNTLESFLEKGLIVRINTGNNKKYYDVSTHPHSHFYDEKTHRIADFNDPGLETIIRDYIARQPVEGFHLSDVRIQLFGEFM